MIKDLDEKTSLDFLKQNKLGRLGCILENGQPYVVPVNYLLDEDKIYIHSLPGQKISAMRSNPQICLQIDKIDKDSFKWQSVIAFGKFVELKDTQMKTNILFRYYGEFPRFTPVEAKFDVNNSLKNVVVFQLLIENLTGVSESF
jgi:nitroimidazol reductase NimA-like FMN-containing flavoprotein (pyridoxamine 5'-phosphate oxidase superfamily)